MAELFEGRLCKNFTLFRLYYKLHGGKKEKKKKIKLQKNFKLKPFRGVDMLVSLS